MKNTISKLALLLAFLLSSSAFLLSCQKQVDINPSDATEVNEATKLASLRNIYRASGDSIKLVRNLKHNGVLSWVPQWNLAFTIESKTFVPMFWKLDKNKDDAPRRMVANAHYLVTDLKSATNRIEIYIPSKPNQIGVSERELIDTFTGKLLSKAIGAELFSSSVYENGVKIKSAPSSKNANDMRTNATTANCLTTYAECYWIATCQQENGLIFYNTDQTYTFTGASCEEPVREACGSYDWGIGWHLASSNVYTLNCVDDNGNPVPDGSNSYLTGKYQLFDSRGYGADYHNYLDVDINGNVVLKGYHTLQTMIPMWEIFPAYQDSNTGKYVYSIRVTYYYQGARAGNSIDVQGASTSRYAPIISYTPTLNNSWNQRWMIEANGVLNGTNYTTYTIKNVNTLMWLSTDNGYNIISLDDNARKISWLLSYIGPV
jgi:hypothetical protein